MKYDVVVVGAGPGGSNAAKAAAEEGLDVLLMEKRQEIGSPKRCAEGFSVGGMKNIGVTPDPKWAVNEIYGASVYAPNGKMVSVRYPDTIGYVLERKIFDKHLAMNAARAGAKVLAKTVAQGLIMEDGYARGVRYSRFNDSHEARAKIVIAADGVESKIARMAGVNTTTKLIDIDAGFQYEMVVDLEEPDMLELFFGSKIAPRGYVWIFPKGKDVANVGIGIGGNAKGMSKKYLDTFIEGRVDLRRGSIIEVNAGGIPVGDPIEKLAVNGLMIVGDAAHQVNAIHGGGVHEASIAGRIAGKVAAEAIKSKDVSEVKLMDYDRRWREERGLILHEIVKLRQVIEKLSDNDLNMLAEHLTGEDMVDFANGRNFMKLAKAMMRRPKLVSIAKGLL
ncbi:MAG: NAD(P)/FAD-dependent oxidoreductase [Candidatus Hydrothermarchaeota archaeon]|nr:NAD(P)/FAD-dependent oxidoreductase [Candidatus Hydrothermarchaeota archaeon]